MANIFSKKWDDITFADVQQLVDNKVSENEILDYKEKWPGNQQVANLVCAMANTYGGLIVFGVSEKDGTNEPERIVGITEEGLSNQLDSVCFDLIEPAVVCQSDYFVADNESKQVFVVKVPPSDITPHAVDDGRTVYIKVQSQKRKTPRLEYDQAKVGYIRWLEDRKQKHVLFRDSLLKSARDEWPLWEKDPRWYRTETYVLPKYPRDEIISYKDLIAALRGFHYTIEGSTAVHRINATGWIPVLDGLRFVQDSELSRSISQVTAHGLYYNLVTTKATKKDKRVLYLDLVLRNFISNLFLGAKLLRGAGYSGAIQCGFAIEGIKGSTLICSDEKNTFDWDVSDDQKNTSTHEGSWTREICANTRASGIKEVAVDIIDRLLFLFEIGVDGGVKGSRLYDYVCRKL